MARTTESRLRKGYPSIEWDEPIHVTVAAGEFVAIGAVDAKQGYACRYCIAISGLKAADFEPMTEDEVRKHIAREHHGRRPS